jgi:hypothetical protein
MLGNAGRSIVGWEKYAEIEEQKRRIENLDTWLEKYAGIDEEERGMEGHEGPAGENKMKSKNKSM